MSLHNVWKKLVFLHELYPLLDASRDAAVASALASVSGSINTNTANIALCARRQWTVNQKSGGYQLVAGDALDTIIESTGSVNFNFTLPADSVATIPLNQPIPFRRMGTGVPTFVAGAGASILCARSAPYTIAAQYGEIVIACKTAANTWWLTGGLS